MSNMMNESPDEEKTYPVKHSAAFAGGTLVTMGLVDVLAHLGPTGLLVGGIASYVAWRHGPELYEQLRGLLPAPERGEPSEPAAAPQHPRQRSLLDRALGRYPEDALAPKDESEPEEEDEAKDEPALPFERLQEEDEDDRFSRMPKPMPPRWPSSRYGLGGQTNRDLLELAPNLRVHKQELAGKAILVCGMRRHGKTTLGALIAELLGAHYIPLLIPDLEGDWLSLADVLPRAVIAGFADPHGQYRACTFASLQSGQAAYQFGYDLLAAGYQVILDMESYATLEQAVVIQVNIIRGMFRWAQSHPDKRVPAHIFLDEAQRYLPQTLSDSIIQDKHILAALLKCYMDIIAVGGKRGPSPVILTQRFAQVNNKIMAQTEVFFLLRQTHDSDLDRCMEYVNSDVATKKQIAAFQPGQGVYIGADGSQVVAHFYERRSSGERSQTPEADAAYRYVQMPLSLSLSLPPHSRPTTALVGGTAGAVWGEDDIPPAEQPPRHLTTPPPVPPATPQVAQEQASSPVVEAPPAKSRPKTELERVLEAYQDHPMASYRELGEKLGMGKDKVGELLRELRERGLIQQ